MPTITEQMKAAAMRACNFTVSSDDIAVGVQLKNYGFLVAGCREVGDEGMRRTSKLVTWDKMEDAAGNPLLDVVEQVIAELQQD